MRLPTAVPAVLGASGIALAAPRPGTSPNILQRQDPLQDKDLYCQNWTRGTAEEAKETWGNLASSLIFANWLQDRDYNKDNWLVEMELDFSSSGLPNGENCRYLGLTCLPGRSSWDCDEYFDEWEGDLWGLNSHWMFEAVHGLHTKLTRLRDIVLQDTLYTDLKVDEMIGAFEAPDSGAPDILGWLVSAVGMGTTIYGMGSNENDEAFERDQTIIDNGAAILGILMDIVGAARGDGEDEGADAGDIRSGLGDALRQTISSLEQTLALATGHTSDGVGYDALPPAADTVWDDPLVAFFDSGFWIVDISGEQFNTMTKVFQRTIQAKTADHIMRTSGLILTGTTTYSQEECADLNGGVWYRPDSWEDDHCWYVARDEGHNVIVNVNQETYDKMAEYGLGDLDMYYRSVIDCANGENGGKTVSVDNLAVGTIPYCFFNMRVGTTYWDTQPGCSGPDPEGVPCPQVMFIADL